MKSRHIFTDKFLDWPSVDSAQMDASLDEIWEQAAHIQQTILPVIKRLNPCDYNRFLDPLMDLRVRLEHLSNLVEDAKQALDPLIIAIEEKEQGEGEGIPFASPKA